MKTIDRVRLALDRIIPPLAGVLFIICVTVTVYGTINRTLALRLSAAWVEEVSVYSMIWCTVLLIGYLLRKGLHTQFTLLEEKMKGRLLRVWRMVIIIIEFAVFVILLIGGVQLTANGSRMLMSALPLTMAWAYLSVPVGSVLVLVELAMLFIEEAAALKKGVNGK